MGVADGLRDGGIDLRHWPMIGTSAGSFAAAAIDTQLGFDHVAALWERYIDAAPPRKRASLIELSETVFAERGATEVGAVAVRLLTLHRHVLSSDRYPLADIVAASSSVLPIVKPHKIDGKRYVDGGTISIASVDLAPNADLLLAITPFAVKALGVGGRLGRFQAHREIKKWSERHHGSVLHVVPSDEMAALGSSRLIDLGNMGIGRAVYPLAVELGCHVADIVHRDHPAIAARIAP